MLLMDERSSDSSSQKQTCTSGSSWEQDLIRSVGSSFSITDESDGEATQLLRDQLKKFEAALYEDGPIDGLLGDALEETKQWSCFPHLRVIGRRIELKGRDWDETGDVEGECGEVESTRALKPESFSDEESSTLSEASSEGSTLKEDHCSDNKDPLSEEEQSNLHRRKRKGSERWFRACSNTSAGVPATRSWYPIQVQNWLPEDILPRHPRLSPIPYESRTSSHYSQHRTACEQPPCIVRHGTLPPIDTLDISSKPLLNRCKSARIGSGCPLSRPTTSRKPIVLSPICGRSSSMKKHPQSGLPKDSVGKELKPLKNPKATVIWKY